MLSGFHNFSAAHTAEVLVQQLDEFGIFQFTAAFVAKNLSYHVFPFVDALREPSSCLLSLEIKKAYSLTAILEPLWSDAISGGTRRFFHKL
jgi:hypothetical protein